MINRHPCFQEIIVHFCPFDTNMLSHSVLTQGSQFLSGQIFIKPDGHVLYLDNDWKTISGRKWLASPLFLMISRTIVDATEVYFGSQVRKTVSMDLSRVRLA